MTAGDKFREIKKEDNKKETREEREKKVKDIKMKIKNKVKE